MLREFPWVYNIGGTTRKEEFCPSEIFNIFTGESTPLAAMNQPRKNFEAIEFHGENGAQKIVVFGGVGPLGKKLKTIEIYDPESNQWSIDLGFLMETPLSHYSAVNLYNQIYVIGG